MDNPRWQFCPWAIRNLSPMGRVWVRCFALGPWVIWLGNIQRRRSLPHAYLNQSFQTKRASNGLPYFGPIRLTIRNPLLYCQIKGSRGVPSVRNVGRVHMDPSASSFHPSFSTLFARVPSLTLAAFAVTPPRRPLLPPSSTTALPPRLEPAGRVHPPHGPV